MERQVNFATVLLMSGLVEMEPAKLPAVRPDIIKDVIQVYKPAGKESRNSSADGPVTVIIGQTHTSRGDDVTDSSHNWCFPSGCSGAEILKVVRINDPLYTP